MKPLTRPLIQFDAGWLFIVAGLAICAAGVILPAQHDFEALQSQLRQLQAEESRAYARLKAHADFMDQVDRADPALIRRLAAAQLNMVPEGDVPILLASSKSAPVTHWIESTIDSDIRPAKPPPISTLSRWADGPHRLYFFGAGIMAVFIGVVLSPLPVRRNRSYSAHEADLYFAHAEQLVDDDDLLSPVALAETAEPYSPTDELLHLELAEDLQGDKGEMSEKINAGTSAQSPIVETQSAPVDLENLRSDLKGDLQGEPAVDESLFYEVDELGLEIVTTPMIERVVASVPSNDPAVELNGPNDLDSTFPAEPKQKAVREPAD